MGFSIRAGVLAAFFVVLYATGHLVGARAHLPAQGEVKPAAVPLTIGEWRGRECPVNQRLLDQREAVVERVYEGPQGLTAHVVIVYSRNWRGIHPPEMCLTAIGWRMRREFTVDLRVPGGPAGRARALVMDRQGGKLGGVYLYADQGTISDSWASLVGRMLDSSREVRCLLGVYIEDTRKGQPDEALTEAARAFCLAVLPYVQLSAKSDGVTGRREH